MLGLLKRVPVWVRVAMVVVLAVTATWFLVTWLAGPDATFIDVATGASGVGTCAAAVVVAWQAIMTRKAVQAAEESAGLSRELIAEAVKTRHDAKAPSTTLVMKDPAQWPPYEPSVGGGKAQQIPLPRQYHLPKDANERIQVRAYLWLWNHSSGPLVASLSNVVSAQWDEQGDQPSTVEVQPGKAAPLLVIETRTVSEWIAAHEDRQNGGTAYRTVAGIGISDGFDDGVIDRWTAELVGSPLRPVQGYGSTWEILPKAFDDSSGREIVHCVITGVERIYYLSKSRNVLLSALTESPVAST